MKSRSEIWSVSTWHRPIEAAQPCLDMAHAPSKLLGGERCGERRVDIARHEHNIRAEFLQQRLQPLEYPSGPSGVRPRADLGIGVGPGQSQLSEEHPRHRVVIVLPGVDEDVLDVRPFREAAGDGCHLHEVRAGANDRQHASLSSHTCDPIAVTIRCPPG